MDILLQGILTAAVIMDFRTGRIRNWFLAAAAAAGAFLRILACGALWYEVLGTAAFPILAFWLLFRMHALGAGDIKLFSVVGCFWSFDRLLFCIFFSFAAGAAASLIRLIAGRELLAGLSSIGSYFQRTFQKKKIEKYPGRDRESHQIRFSAAVYIGFLLTLGVMYGKSVCNFM